MLLILLSWIYILFTVLNIGHVTQRCFQIRHAEFSVTAMLGLFSTTLIAGIWALFGRLHWEFHLFLLIVNLILIIFCRKQIFTIYGEIGQMFQGLPKRLKILFIIIILLILANCASAPFILDNESYYLQTIKWLNEYGYVKGIGNLHIFFAQQSGWHLAQSAFSFSFLYDHFNDLSGFCLVIGNLFAFHRLRGYYQNQSKRALIFGLFPAVNLLLLQFVSAPSPDLSVYVLTFLIVYYFIKNYSEKYSGGFTIISILAIFAVFIKPTAIVLLIFPGVIFLRNYRSLLKSAIRVSLLSILVLALYLGKNYITSGHPFFPIAWSPGGNFAVPDNIAEFYYTTTKLFGFRISAAEYDAMTVTELFVTWLQLPKLHGIFNWLMVIIIFAAPIFLFKLKQRAWWIVYFVMLVQLFLLALSSPQYRFFLNFILLFACFCASFFIIKKYLISVLGFATFFAAIFTFFSVDLRGLTNNQANAFSSPFSLSNFVFPHPNSKSNLSFELIDEGSLKYYSPVNHYFFWGTGDGPLPCVNSEQIEYFKKHFRVVPQPLGPDIGDGFSARELSPIE